MKKYYELIKEYIEETKEKFLKEAIESKEIFNYNFKIPVEEDMVISVPVSTFYYAEHRRAKLKPIEFIISASNYKPFKPKDYAFTYTIQLDCEDLPTPLIITRFNVYKDGTFQEEVTVGIAGLEGYKALDVFFEEVKVIE